MLTKRLQTKYNFFRMVMHKINCHVHILISEHKVKEKTIYNFYYFHFLL